MTSDLAFLLVGASLLFAVVLPDALRGRALSAPVILLLVGMGVGLLPLPPDVDPSPVGNRTLVEHLTGLTVMVALMGVGLALDRPLSLRSAASWARWSPTWRLLGLAMPLCIAGVTLLGWAAGLAPAAALLVASALAPTDPVLASDVQVEGPTTEQDAEGEEIDEQDEVRFALTSEAGLNDGLAFPFVYAAVFMLDSSQPGEWVARWFAWELVGKVVVGVVVGALSGWLLARLAFRAPKPSLRLAETGEPLLALAAVLLSYGAAELVGGYGFLAVFACAVAMRSADRGHDYHVHMHESLERLERLLTLVVLLLLGMTLTTTLLPDLTWAGVGIGVALVFVLRPLTAYAALRLPLGRGDRILAPGERRAVAFFGVRGVGSLYYLAYASGHAEVPHLDELWAVVGFTIALSVLVHGVSASPVMDRLGAETQR